MLCSPISFNFLPGYSVSAASSACRGAEWLPISWDRFSLRHTEAKDASCWEIAYPVFFCSSFSPCSRFFARSWMCPKHHLSRCSRYRKKNDTVSHWTERESSPAKAVMCIACAIHLSDASGLQIKYDFFGSNCSSQTSVCSLWKLPVMLHCRRWRSREDPNLLIYWPRCSEGPLYNHSLLTPFWHNGKPSLPKRAWRANLMFCYRVYMCFNRNAFNLFNVLVFCITEYCYFTLKWFIWLI